MSSSCSPLWLALFGLLPVVATCAPQRAEAELLVEAEPEDLSGVASRNPLPAWAAARAELPAGHEIRRLAFAPHGLNVFSAPAGVNAPMRTAFLSHDGQRYQTVMVEERSDIACKSAGATTEAVDRALKRLLDEPDWTGVSHQSGGLQLECLTDEALHWSVMLIPPGGYQEGVAIETRRFDFQPD